MATSEKAETKYLRSDEHRENFRQNVQLCADAVIKTKRQEDSIYDTAALREKYL